MLGLTASRRQTRESPEERSVFLRATSVADTIYKLVGSEPFSPCPSRIIGIINNFGGEKDKYTDRFGNTVLYRNRLLQIAINRGVDSKSLNACLTQIKQQESTRRLQQQGLLPSPSPPPIKETNWGWFVGIGVGLIGLTVGSVFLIKKRS